MTGDKGGNAAQPQFTPQMLTVFAEPGFDPVVVEAADLVRLRMDGNFQVLEVSLHPAKDRGHGQKADHRLEAALVEAFNEALRQVTERNGARLKSLLDSQAAGGVR